MERSPELIEIAVRMSGGAPASIRMNPSRSSGLTLEIAASKAGLPVGAGPGTPTRGGGSGAAGAAPLGGLWTGICLMLAPESTGAKEGLYATGAALGDAVERSSPTFRFA